MKYIYGYTCKVFNNSYTVFRGYADARLIASISRPSEAYQRKTDDEHTKEIAEFIRVGRGTYTPEVTLAYSVASADLTDIISNASGKHEENGIAFSYTGGTKGFVRPMTIGIYEQDRVAQREKVFSRIDGNHRLSAFELLDDGKDYIIPVSILFLVPESGETSAQRVEMRMFHNINGKAKMLTNIEQFRGFLNLFSTDELQVFGQQFSITKAYMDTYGEAKIKFGNCDTACDDLILSCAQFLVNREISITHDELHNAFVYLDEKLLPLRKHELDSFSNRFAIVPFVYYYIKDTTAKKDRLLAYTNWFIRSKLYSVEDFDPASSINSFENVPRKIFMSMQFGDKTKDTYDVVEQVRDSLKRDSGIELDLFKVDEHKDGYSDEIYHRITSGIQNADLVIADLTYGNKNVHHEIGYAQGLGKKVLLLWQERDGADADDEIGSNLKMHDQVRFRYVADLRVKLIEKIRQCFGL
jgi:hypothetical protein